MNGESMQVYWAGALFDSKEVIGNLLLSRAVAAACPRWKIVLPQELESGDAGSIRDSDYEMLISSDLLVANFDGCDLDSGTVAEFCFAKMLDIPAVLFRSDFRDGRDQESNSDPWNLMCSGYPRCERIVVDGPRILRKYRGSSGDPERPMREAVREQGALISAALERLTTFPAVLKLTESELNEHYRRCIALAGGRLGERFPARRIAQLVHRKRSCGLY